MKVTVLGIEASQGVSKKGPNAGNAYSIGTLHTMIELAPAIGKESFNKGFAGDKMRCDLPLLAKLRDLPFPLDCEVTSKPVLQFGERVELVVDVVPLTHIKRAA